MRSPGTAPAPGSSVAALRRRSEPAVELPAHPVGGGVLGQRLGATPHPGQLPAAGGDGVDGQPGAPDPGRLRDCGAGRQPTSARRTPRRRPGRSAGRSAARRRVPGEAHDRAARARLAAGEAVGGHRIGIEPGGDITAGQLGELAERPNSHAPQQIGQLFAPGPDRLGSVANCLIDSAGQERRIRTGLDDPPGAGREDGGGQLVGDSHLAFGTGGGDGVDQPFGGGLLGAEVAGRAAHRQHQQARPQHLGARHHIVDARRHALEEPGVAGRIGGGDVHLRAAAPAPRAAAVRVAPRPRGPPPSRRSPGWPG